MYSFYNTFAGKINLECLCISMEKHKYLFFLFLILRGRFLLQVTLTNSEGSKNMQIYTASKRLADFDRLDDILQTYGILLYSGCQSFPFFLMGFYGL